MASNAASSIDQARNVFPARGSGGTADGHAVNDRDMVESVHRWGTEGGRILVNVGDMVDRANQRHTTRATITLLAKDAAAGLPHGGFRIGGPSLLTTHDIKTAIRDSEARGLTGDVRRTDTGEYTIAFRPLPRGARHAEPDAYDGVSTANILRERPRVMPSLVPPKTT